MTDREKLIVIIGLTGYGNGALVGKNFQRGFIEKIADNLIENGVTVQKWIPVSERLPKYREDVLVTDGKSVCTAWLSKSNSWVRSYTSAILDGFTHWMPLPRPPKGE